LLILFPALVLAAEFHVTRLNTQLRDGVYEMDAEIDFEFSDKALEALQNGVPLTLQVHIQLRREGAWIWEKDQLDVRLRYRIRYQSLPAVYQVVDLQSNTQQSFVTREAALEALGEISGLPLVSEDRLQPDRDYLLSFYTELDIEALPLPLRPLAYLTPSWNLSSEWSTWRLQP
jgi:hypothetical protein